MLWTQPKRWCNTIPQETTAESTTEQTRSKKENNRECETESELNHDDEDKQPVSRSYDLISPRLYQTFAGPTKDACHSTNNQ